MSVFLRFISLFSIHIVLFLCFSFAFVTLGLFPYNYQLVEADQNAIVLETRILNQQTTIDFSGRELDKTSSELMAAITNNFLTRLDRFLLFISLSLAGSCTSIGSYILHKRKEKIVKKHYTFAIALFTVQLFLYGALYIYEVSKLHNFMNG
ncbi:hypothetical protein MM326_04875 [Alkalihalobacillus sp. LMS6]|uniref:hypothetical protein n=1 Tax=Bacillaceae TaxID=186817 RepID=UPI000C079866|nr:MULTISPECIES: hypothetical protein [Bacillaceae]UTR07368.1 hypothetical protein MM326_04875 [Alkalihalobacillus sp. LMS6]